MNPTIRLLFGTVLSIWLTGCTTGQTIPPATDHSGPVQQHPQSTEEATAHPPPGIPLRQELPDPRGELSLRQALDLTLARSPGLQASSREFRRSRALERQAALWNNPEIAFELEDITEQRNGSDAEARETTIAISQTLPLGRDIAHRRRLAAARSGIVNWEYESTRLEMLLQTTERFIRALAAERRLAIAEKELNLARETREVTRKRVDAGDLSPVELMRVEVPVVNAELALEREKRLREAAHRLLALSWDSREASFATLAGDLEIVPEPPHPERLAQSINSNPDIARWTSAIAEQIAIRRLARAEAIPDPTLRLGLKQRDDPDETSLVVGISLPLPVFDRRQGDILAAREGEAAARQEKRAAELRIAELLTTSLSRFANAHDEVLALRDRALPAAGEAFLATQQAFAEGKLSFLDVLDAQRTLFDLETRHLDALVACHLAAAEIVSLLGQPLEELAP